MREPFEIGELDSGALVRGQIGQGLAHEPRTLRKIRDGFGIRLLRAELDDLLERLLALSGTSTGPEAVYRAEWASVSSQVRGSPRWASYLEA